MKVRIYGKREERGAAHVFNSPCNEATRRQHVIMQRGPQLKESKRRPLANQIAKALCLSADERFDEALTELDQIQAILSSEDAPGSSRDESKDMPLYRTAVLLFQGAGL